MAFSSGGKFYGRLRWIICWGIKSLVTIVIGAVLMDRCTGWKWGHYGSIKTVDVFSSSPLTLNLLPRVYCLALNWFYVYNGGVKKERGEFQISLLVHSSPLLHCSGCKNVKEAVTQSKHFNPYKYFSFGKNQKYLIDWVWNWDPFESFLNLLIICWSFSKVD